MYIRKNLRPINVDCLSVKRKRVFDSFTDLGFEYNSEGFIRNDFSQLMERETQVGYMRALQAMQAYTEEHSNEGKTFEEIVREVRPRWCQLNGEVDRFEQYLIDNALDFYKKLRDDSTPQGKVASEVASGTGVTPTVEPAVVGSAT